SGPTVGEPTIGPRARTLHACLGFLAGALPAVCPVCWALPPNIAYGPAPCGRAAWPGGGLPDPVAADTGRPARSTHSPPAQTRWPLQSVSLPHPSRTPLGRGQPSNPAVTSRANATSESSAKRNVGGSARNLADQILDLEVDIRALAYQLRPAADRW